MAEQIYKEWFVRMRFPGYEEAEFEKGLPKEWIWKKFTEVVSVLSGGTPKTAIAEYWNGDIFWFSPSDVQNSFFVLNTEKTITELGLRNCSSKLYPENTIFITARGTVGKCVLTGVPMAMNQTNYALKSKDGFGLSQFYTYLMVLELVDGFKKVANGAVFDTITTTTFERTKILLPDEEVLKKFSEIITPLFVQTKSLLQQNSILKQTRDLLLPRLISGKLRLTPAFRPGRKKPHCTRALALNLTVNRTVCHSSGSWYTPCGAPKTGTRLFAPTCGRNCCSTSARTPKQKASMLTPSTRSPTMCIACLACRPIRPSKALQLMKGEAAHWANKARLIKPRLEWADDYFAASVSESQLDKVRFCIRNQDEHHRKQTFAEEYGKFIRSYGLTKPDGQG